MKITDLIASYITNPKLQGKLKNEISLDDGTIFQKGTISEVLIKKHDGNYHFESDHSDCTVSHDEIEFV